MRKRTVFACFKIGVSAALTGLLLFLPVVVQAQAGFKGIPVLLYHYVGAEAPDYPYLNVDTAGVFPANEGIAGAGLSVFPWPT